MHGLELLSEERKGELQESEFRAAQKTEMGGRIFAKNVLIFVDFLNPSWFP
jgi:hypothetical protein